MNYVSTLHKWNLFSIVTSRRYAYHLQCSQLWHLSFSTSFLKSSEMEQIQPLQGTPNLKRDQHLIFILGSIPCIQVGFPKLFKSMLGSLTWKQRWMFLNSYPKFLRTNRTWLYFGLKTKYFNIWITYLNIIIITLLFWHASKSCQNEDENCCTIKVLHYHL